MGKPAFVRRCEPLTREELDRAIALKASGLTWEAVALRFGRPTNSLEVSVCAYRKGRLKFQREGILQDLATYLELALEGLTLSAIAARTGSYKTRVHHVLARAGWDAETIREERELRRAQAQAA